MDDGALIFASDFHLSPRGKPEVLSVFISFVEERVYGAKSFFILGDLFDYWTGKGMLSENGLLPVFDCLMKLSSSGTKVTILHGNRDFLMRNAEAQRFGASVAGESLDISVGGDRRFLTHGDMFCTMDRSYQRMKRVLRSPMVRTAARFFPQKIALWTAGRFRRISERAVQKKTSYTTSLDLKSIQSVISKGINIVICGHTHDCEDTVLANGGRLISLSDWGNNGGTYADFRNGSIGLKLFSK